MLILNLPYDHTLKIATFHKIEDKLGHAIWDITLQAIKDVLDEETCLHLKKWKRRCLQKKWNKQL